MGHGNIPEFKCYSNEKSHDKGWGKEYWLLNDEELCCKILLIEKNKKSSLHFHVAKEEIFFIVQGALSLTWIDTRDGTEHVQEMSQGESVFIPKAVPHRFRGISDEPCIFVESSTHHKDEDSYRVQAGDSQK